MRRFFQATSMLATLLLVAPNAQSQVSPEEHAAHHPDQSTPAGEGEASQQGGMQGMGDMGEMMSRMGVPPPKDIYPSLMDLPDMTAEERDAFEQLAHERMQTGAALMGQALDDLLKASPTQDFGAMQSAVDALREGLGQFDSGLAAHRVMNSNTAPDQAAMTWFKREMNLLPPPARATSTGPFGWSWFHMSVMTVLIVFAMVMIALYFVKMRRAAELLQDLAAQPRGSAAPPAPETSGATSSQPAASAAPVLDVPDQPAAAMPAKTTRRTGDQWTGALQLAATFQETPDIRTFRLMLPSGEPVPFAYLPGQFLTVEVPVDGKVFKRSYTIASSPTRPEYIELSIKREGQGVVSRALHDSLSVADSLTVTGPTGVFTFTGDEEGSIVLVSGGVGITPMMSVIRYLTDRAWDGEIYLLHCCRTTDDFCFRDELEYLQRKHPGLNVTATMTRARGSAWVGPTGRFSAGLIRECVPEIATKLVHLCGPPPMMEALNGMLCELGVPQDRVKTEAFGPAKRPQATERPGTGAATVAFTASGKSAPIGPETTVLEAAESVGVDIENSCRAGTCGSCKVRLLKGRVSMDVEDALDDNDRRDGVILACQAKSEVDLEVEA